MEIEELDQQYKKSLDYLYTFVSPVYKDDINMKFKMEAVSYGNYVITIYMQYKNGDYKGINILPDAVKNILEKNDLLIIKDTVMKLEKIVLKDFIKQNGE